VNVSPGMFHELFEVSGDVWAAWETLRDINDFVYSRRIWIMISSCQADSVQKKGWRTVCHFHINVHLVPVYGHVFIFLRVHEYIFSFKAIV
jgi:hypothetical protein